MITWMNKQMNKQIETWMKRWMNDCGNMLKYFWTSEWTKWKCELNKFTTEWLYEQTNPKKNIHDQIIEQMDAWMTNEWMNKLMNKQEVNEWTQWEASMTHEWTNDWANEWMDDCGRELLTWLIVSEWMNIFLLENMKCWITTWIKCMK